MAGATMEPHQQRYATEEVHLTRRIQSINIKRKIDGLSRADAVFDLLYDSIHANGIDLSRFHNLEAAIPIILIITWSAQRCPNSSMDIRVVG